MNKNKTFLYFILPTVIAFCVVLGVYLGAYLSQNSVDKTIIFPVNAKLKNSNKLNEILNFIEDMYVDTVNKGELTEISIASILSKLDPHSYYIPAKEFNEMNDPLEGNFQGIGVEFRINNDTVMILSVIANGPSEKVGLEAGDRIIKVGKKTIAGNGITNENVIKLLKGPKGTKVNVSVARKGIKKLIYLFLVQEQLKIYLL